MLRDIKEFDTKSAKNTGGKTGSRRVSLHHVGTQDPPLCYQLKPSILDNTLLRRLKASFSDHENFGEVIAARIAKAVLPDNIPEVDLVYDSDSQRILIASKYLTESKIRTLDYYAREQGVSVNGKTHVKLVHGLAGSGELSIDGEENAFLRKGMANAIAVSIITGDHDINPGNILVIQDNSGIERIARIDFGHAFNDLISAPEMMGGGIKNS